jgi:hypothetical protein
MLMIRFADMKHLKLVALAACLSACGGSTTTPSVAQVGGVWAGLASQSSVSSGQCSDFFVNGAESSYTLSITQTGSTLAATSSSQLTGISCSYTGTAGSNTVTLNATSCSTSAYQVTCNGAARDIFLVGLSVTATISGNAMIGTAGETWNVFPRGNTTNGLGMLGVDLAFSFMHQ